MNYEHFLRRVPCGPQTRTEGIRRRPLRGGLALETDPRWVTKIGAAQDAAQVAAVEIAAPGAAMPARQDLQRQG